jgi:hypothetical protein
MAILSGLHLERHFLAVIGLGIPKRPLGQTPRSPGGRENVLETTLNPTSLALPQSLQSNNV